ncbi:MAG: MaoC family dehydratase [Leucobacter sp.]
MTHSSTYNDVRLTDAHVGSVLGVSDLRKITQDQINEFARLTGDLQWVHVNPERAATGMFGTTIAHGYLVLSLLPSFTREIIDFARMGTVINYGLDRVRFIHPAKVETPLSDRITLKSLSERPSGLLISLSHELSDPQSNQTVCLADTLTLLRPSA